MFSGVMIILQAVWTEVVTQLDTLIMKVNNKESSISSWLKWHKEVQDRRVQDHFDIFDSRITRQFSSGQTLDVVAIRAEIAAIKGMVVTLSERLVIIEPIIDTMIPTVEILNIWAVLMDEL